MTARRSFDRPRTFGPLKSPQEFRRQWAEAVDLAGTAAGDASALADGADIAPSGQAGVVLTRLVVALRDLAPDTFPLPGFAPRVVAGSFLMLARAFVQPQGNAPEARTVLAPLLAPAARGVDGLLHELRRREAAGWQSQFPERED